MSSSEEWVVVMPVKGTTGSKSRLLGGLAESGLTWGEFDRATQAREFQPRPGKLCDWCEHRDVRCSAFGHEVPPWPDHVPGPEEPLAHQRAAVEAHRRSQLPAT